MSASAIASAAPSASASSDIVTSASEAAQGSWGDAGSVLTAGAIDGNALRARNHARLAADKSAVTIVAGNDVRALGRRICEASVPKRDPQTPVLIKPNIGGFEWFRDPEKNGGDDGLKGRITQPEFVRGIVQCLKARGFTTITIAEGWGATHKDWQHLIAASGYEAMAKEENVPLVAMDDDGVFDVQGTMPGKPIAVNGMEKTGMPSLLLPKILAETLEHGLFISAPKLKTHRFGVVSIGIKGMQGVVMTSDASPAFHQKWRSHRELSRALTMTKNHDPNARAEYVKSLEIFSERMTDMLEVAAPDVVLAEGAPAMGGDGFGKQIPAPDNVAIGGTNVVTVDRIGAEFLGLWDNDALGKELLGHKTSPLIEAAAKRFAVDISAPVVDGDGAALLKFKRPANLIGMADFVIHESGSGARDAIDAGGTSGAPSLEAKHVANAPAIDAVMDDAWKDATPTSFATDYAGASTFTKTTVRALWDKDALYMLFELENAAFHVDMSKPVKEERDKLYDEDCVEMFLAPSAQNRDHYYEIEIGPRGHFFDLAIDHTPSGRTKSDAGWSGNLDIATRIDEVNHRAVIEVAVRSQDITRVLVPGAHLPLGMFRMEGKEPSRQYLAWSPPRTKRPNFHVPNAFGELVVAP